MDRPYKALKQIDRRMAGDDHTADNVRLYAPDGIDLDALHPASRRVLAMRQIEQRSDEWYEIRNRLLTASDAHAALGIKPFESFSGDPRRLLIAKKRRALAGQTDASTPSFAMQYGIDNEDAVRSMFEEKKGVRVIQAGLIVHPKHSWLAASIDGIVAETGELVEIKCPQSRDVTDEVPHHYMPQVQVQLQTTGCEKCWFVQYKNPRTSWPKAPVFSCVLVERDDDWFERNVETLHSCWREFMAADEQV